jgi:hypothetical protein
MRRSEHLESASADVVQEGKKLTILRPKEGSRIDFPTQCFTESDYSEWLDCITGVSNLRHQDQKIAAYDKELQEDRSARAAALSDRVTNQLPTFRVNCKRMNLHK